jgi:hypothetical protein
VRRRHRKRHSQIRCELDRVFGAIFDYYATLGDTVRPMRAHFAARYAQLHGRLDAYDTAVA